MNIYNLHDLICSFASPEGHTPETFEIVCKTITETLDQESEQFFRDSIDIINNRYCFLPDDEGEKTIPALTRAKEVWKQMIYDITVEAYEEAQDENGQLIFVTGLMKVYEPDGSDGGVTIFTSQEESQ